ncbi:MAG: sigma-70 family RNA polymerase sigma factor [Planctomycetaceae bacterium]|nr:sigma-70 family RNA polymerase sigma factor [Planctomycetaceae bacterium]
MLKSDQQLIAECLAGQTHVFGDLVLRYQDRLYNMLINVLGSGEDARDVAQEAFVSAFQKLHTFKGQSAFYSWLFRIAMNSAVSRQRKRNHIPVSIEALRSQTGLEPTDQHPDNHPSYSMESAERQAAVQAALADLPEEFRKVLVLKEMDELRYEEIAAIVGCPIGTVRSRIHRARAELRNRLAPLLHEPAEK